MPKFHVFLSHNSKDKPGVRKLKNRLTSDYDLTVWFDEDALPPGIPWQTLLEEGIVNSGSIAVLIGADGRKKAGLDKLVWGFTGVKPQSLGLSDQSLSRL